jgi:hypothetical protein
VSAVHARVTRVHVDTERASVEEVLHRFRVAVLPALQEQPGYRGIYVLGTQEGDGVLLSLWASEEAAEAMHPGGWYFGVLRDFATFLDATPDRQAFEVLLRDLPGAQPTA